MSEHEQRAADLPPFDMQSRLVDDQGLPRPDWDQIKDWVEKLALGDREHELWVEIERQWLENVGPALGLKYRAIESDHFLVLIDKPDATIDRYLDFAERCRSMLLHVLPGVANFDMLGKQVVFALNGAEDYYRYVNQFDRRDEGGASGGMQIRRGHPHVVCNTPDLAGGTTVLAHELTHAALMHLDMPEWLEEGLAQMFEHDATGRQLLLVDPEMGREHREYWHTHGLAEFWSGDGFHSGEIVQKLSYQLAEIIVRLLVEDHRPRWFGLSRGKQHQLLAFLQEAKSDDCGAAAAQRHLGLPITELPTKFLGPGPWSRGLVQEAPADRRRGNGGWSTSSSDQRDEKRRD